MLALPGVDLFHLDENMIDVRQLQNSLGHNGPVSGYNTDVNCVGFQDKRIAGSNQGHFDL